MPGEHSLGKLYLEFRQPITQPDKHYCLLRIGMRKRQNAVLAAITGFGHACSVWTCVSSVQLYAQSGRVIGTPCVFFPCSWWRSFAHGKNSKCFAWSRSCVSFCIWIVDPRTWDLPCSSIGLCLVQVRHQFFTSRFTWFPDAHDFHGTQQDAGSEPCLLTTQAYVAS